MTQFESLTVSEAADQLNMTISTQPQRTPAPKWWSFRFLGLNIYCYNFKWRQEALAHHDLHHIVTGYPCTMRGEMQVATWEFAAGRYPNIFANLFCLPLVSVGVVLIPKLIWRAFRLGRRSNSLFGAPITEHLLATSVGDMRKQVKSMSPSAPLIKDVFAFGALIIQSTLLAVSPLILLYVATS
ncbi:MAG: hypothetical protein ABJN26_08020 [Stappiaceae bacterium]